MHSECRVSILCEYLYHSLYLYVGRFLTELEGDQSSQQASLECLICLRISGYTGYRVNPVEVMACL